MSLTESILEGNRLALARLLTQVENDSPEGRTALVELFPHTGKAHLIGVTGAPGTGKSSLVNQLALYYRKNENKKIAIIAVDPSSPFTGGAVLGDRVRMRDLSGDNGIFIRSMASRGSVGGIAQATASITQIFDAAGYDIVIIETVGAGQSEVDVARLAHTTIVVEAPGLGDDIQAIKAGILEIADILVINKADRPGVENTERALRSTLELAHPTKRVFRHHGQTMTTDVTPPKGHRGDAISHDLLSKSRARDTDGVGGAKGLKTNNTDSSLSSTAQNDMQPLWIPPIVKTVATEGKGIAELADSIARHVGHLHQSGDWAARDRARLGSELEEVLRDVLMGRFMQTVPQTKYEEIVEKVLNRNISPYEAVNLLLDGISKS